MEEVRVEGARAVERVIAWMRRVEDGPLSLEEMAGMAHLSPFHFSRVFKMVTGVSPGAFMSALRMERAKRLLLTTEMSVSEVCFETGYESLGTFTARFTQLVGVSPGQLRRLPERLPGTLGWLPEERTPTAGGVTFRVSGPDLDGALIFAGLFPTAILQGRPVTCAVFDGPGTCRIPSVPDGVYFLLVAALPRSGDPMRSLLPGPDLRVGRAPVVVRRGSATDPVDITLRLALTTDPPVLLVLPTLLPRE